MPYVLCAGVLHKQCLQMHGMYSKNTLRFLTGPACFVSLSDSVRCMCAPPCAGASQC